MNEVVRQAVEKYPHSIARQVQHIVTARLRQGHIKIRVPEAEDGVVALVCSLLLRHGYVNPKMLRRRLGVSYPTARKHLDKAREFLGLAPRQPYQRSWIRLQELLKSEVVEWA